MQSPSIFAAVGNTSISPLCNIVSQTEVIVTRDNKVVIDVSIEPFILSDGVLSALLDPTGIDRFLMFPSRAKHEINSDSVLEHITR